MSFSDAIKTCLSKYAVFSGRASRAEYWWFFLFYVAAYVVAIVIDSVLGTPFVITAIAVLALILPALSAGIRRLHDTDRSGWWYLIGIIPFVGGIWLLVLLVQEGTAGPNRYGA
jgi:uncharacterized membrane protein YhaH (DUF805 family)